MRDLGFPVPDGVASQQPQKPPGALCSVQGSPHPDQWIKLLGIDPIFLGKLTESTYRQRPDGCFDVLVRGANKVPFRLAGVWVKNGWVYRSSVVQIIEDK